MNKRKNKSNSAGSKKVSYKQDHLEKDPYTFEPFDTWKWRTFHGEKALNLDEFIEKNKNRLFFIGTDSQQYPKNKKCVFTSVLIAYDYDKDFGGGHGATIARHTDKRHIVPIYNLGNRLTVEVQRSIELCKHLESTLERITENEMESLRIKAEENGWPDEYLMRKLDAADYTDNMMGVCIDVSRNDIDESSRYKESLAGMVIQHGWRAYIKPEAWGASSVADKKC